MSFYKVFGHNRLIEIIDGYDGTVHHGPFFKNVAAIGSWMERLDEAFDMRYKTPSIASLESRSDGQDAPRRFQSRLL